MGETSERIKYAPIEVRKKTHWPGIKFFFDEDIFERIYNEKPAPNKIIVGSELSKVLKEYYK